MRVTWILFVFFAFTCDALFWSKKGHDDWAKNYLLKAGVSEDLATAALDGLSPQQLKDMSKVEMKILGRILKTMDVTLGDLEKFVTKVIPGVEEAEMRRLNSVLSQQIRRILDIAFHTMDEQGKKKKFSLKQLITNTHNHVFDTLTRHIPYMHSQTEAERSHSHGHMPNVHMPNVKLPNVHMPNLHMPNVHMHPEVAKENTAVTTEEQGEEDTAGGIHLPPQMQQKFQDAVHMAKAHLHTPHIPKPHIPKPHIHFPGHNKHKHEL